VLLAAVGTAAAIHLTIDTEGHTTLEQVLTCTDPDQDGCEPGYDTLEVDQVSKDFLERDTDSVDGTPQNPNPAIPKAAAGRESRRRSLAYVSQMTDFQLADEESPARVEFLDPGRQQPAQRDRLGPRAAGGQWTAQVQLRHHRPQLLPDDDQPRLPGIP
jgi:hypothetical protein